MANSNQKPATGDNPRLADSFSITVTPSSNKPPQLPFHKMKEGVLGKRYCLSLVFTGERAMRRLNRTYRRQNKPADILSFPINAMAGEIFISIAAAKKESEKFGRPLKNFIAFLFIHGLFHLKGFDHGSTMEGSERTVRKKFGI